MQCLLKDANKGQHQNNCVRNWIAEVRDLAYQAEDVIETYAVEFSSRKEKGFRKLLKRFSCALNKGLTLHQIGSEILQIKSEVERVHKSMQAYGLSEIIKGESSISSTPNENQQWKWQTYPFDIEDCFVGKEDDLNRLVSLIVDDKQHRVISIWGMGGIGKTTIARKVYNNSRTKHSFESFAWVCITQQCRIRSVLEEVLNQLNPQQSVDIRNSSNTVLVQLLCEVQNAKRCLIVLDDLWQMEHWNGLKPAFLAVGLKNKLLLTTRNKDVAAAAGFPHELRLLNADDGWKLLKKKAFLENNITANEELFKEKGKEMVGKCGYLPLGICLLGGILSNKESLTEWELVNKNINAHLGRAEGEEMICRATGFPKLKTLELNGLSNLREWRIEEGAMSSLRTLGINSCQNLKTIPDGLKFITTLQKLEIIRMPELGKRISAMSDDGEGEDYHKICHVPSVYVR